MISDLPVARLVNVYRERLTVTRDELTIDNIQLLAATAVSNMIGDPMTIRGILLFQHRSGRSTCLETRNEKRY